MPCAPSLRGTLSSSLHTTPTFQCHNHRAAANQSSPQARSATSQPSGRHTGTARASRSRMRSGLRALSWRRRPAAAPALQELLARRGLGARQQVPLTFFDLLWTFFRTFDSTRSSRRLWQSPQLVARTPARRGNGESGRDDENVIPELDTPRHCGGDPRGDLVNELVDGKTVATRFCSSVSMLLAYRSRCWRMRFESRARARTARLPSRCRCRSGRAS